MNDQPPPSPRLTAAGWTCTGPGRWRSPLTEREYPERAALAMLALKPRATRTSQPAPSLRHPHNSNP